MLRGASAIGLFIALALAGAAYATECKDDPEVVGQCFQVHGRFHGTAGGRRRLSPVGGDPLRGRDFSVQRSPNSKERSEGWSWMPDELLRIAEGGEFHGPGRLDVYGDFEVCRLAPDKPGHIGFVCIQSAKHLVIQKDR